MSETVQVALITLAAGLVGALIGSITTLVVAMLNSRNEVKRCLWAERHRCYSNLVGAYNTLILAITSQSTTETMNLAYTDFQREYAKAVLLCEFETIEPLNLFLKEVSEFAASHQSDSALRLAYGMATLAMRRELLPKKELKHERKSNKGKNTKSHG